jgi:hypothetical protein
MNDKQKHGRTCITKENQPRLEVLFANGVFRNVLEEIINAQKKDANLISYLQPYSSDVNSYRLKPIAVHIKGIISRA